MLSERNVPLQISVDWGYKIWRLVYYLFIYYYSFIIYLLLIYLLFIYLFKDDLRIQNHNSLNEGLSDE
jgi:hypothetical protein